MIDAVELVERLRHSIRTASNDDLSLPMTDKRSRHVARIDAMSEAADAIERLTAERWRTPDTAPKDGTSCDLLLSSGREVSCAYWGETIGAEEEGWFAGNNWARGEDEEVIRWKPFRSPLRALKSEAVK